MTDVYVSLGELWRHRCLVESKTVVVAGRMPGAFPLRTVDDAKRITPSCFMDVIEPDAHSIVDHGRLFIFALGPELLSRQRSRGLRGR